MNARADSSIRCQLKKTMNLKLDEKAPNTLLNLVEIQIMQAVRTDIKLEVENV